MPFIQNGSRKPKFVAKLTLSKNTKSGYSFSSSSDNLKEMGALRAYISDNISNTVFYNKVKLSDASSKLKIEELRSTYLNLKLKENIGVYFTTNKNTKYSVEVFVYFIKLSNVVKENTIINNNGFSGDTIVLSENADFEDHEVYNGHEFKIFFNKKEKSLVTVIHREDIAELMENKNFVLIETNDIEVKEDKIILGKTDKVKVKTIKERNKLEIDKKNQSRLVLSVNTVKQKNSVSVNFIEKGKSLVRHVSFLNYKDLILENMAEGKYKVYNQTNKKESWLIVDSTKGFLGKTKEILIVDENEFSEKLKSVKEIDLFEKKQSEI